MIQSHTNRCICFAKRYKNIRSHGATTVALPTDTHGQIACGGSFATTNADSFPQSYLYRRRCVCNTHPDSIKIRCESTR